MAYPFDLITGLARTTSGVLHVGANIGQEFDDYRAAGLDLIAWVEADHDIAMQLEEKIAAEPNQIVLHGLCGARDGERVPFHVASNEGQSSSMFDFGWHAERYPSIVMNERRLLTTVRLDTLIAEAAALRRDLAWDAIDTLVLDVQGAEMQVLYGAGAVLRGMSFVYTEVNEGGMYQRRLQC